MGKRKKVLYVFKIVILGIASFSFGLIITLLIFNPPTFTPGGWNTFTPRVLLNKLKLPKLYIVQSGSMEPAIKTGSVVVSYPAESYVQGDVITFAPNGDSKKLITHRIVFKLYPDGANSTARYITGGDANEDFDTWEIKDEYILGKNIFTIPYLGYIANYAKTPYGFLLLVIVPATIIIYEELKSLFKEIGFLIKKFFSKVSLVFKRKHRDKTLGVGTIHPPGGNEAIPKDRSLPKVSVLLPVIGAGIVFLGLTSSFFSDIENSIGNLFQAADWSPPPPSVAQTLVMNELLPLSSCDSGQTNGQYLELWNGSGGDVNLQNFKLADVTNTPIAIANSNTNLPNGSFAILIKSVGVINQCLGGNVNNAVTVNLGGQLDLNTGTLQLLDSNDSVLDTIKWGANETLQPSTDQSIERVPIGIDTQTGTNFSSDDLIIREKYTPGYGSNLVLNELLPNPNVTFTDEWVEIYNPSGSSIDLTNWTLKDIANPSKSITTLGIINPSSWKVYEDTGDGWLNNSSLETLQLLDPSGKVIDQHTFTFSSPAGTDKSTGRNVDRGNIWVQYCLNTSKGTTNNSICQ